MEEKTKYNVEQFASDLFEVEVNIHIAHLQTTSFAEHKALDAVYKDIVDLRDRFIESYQGEYDIITGYKSFEIKEGIEPISYLDGLCEKFEEYRETLEYGYLQQIIDDILELFYSAKYKLKFLK